MAYDKKAKGIAQTEENKTIFIRGMFRIEIETGVSIEEYRFRFVKRNTMFLDIGFRFTPVPCKTKIAHNYIIIIEWQKFKGEFASELSGRTFSMIYVQSEKSENAIIRSMVAKITSIRAALLDVTINRIVRPLLSRIPNHHTQGNRFGTNRPLKPTMNRRRAHSPGQKSELGAAMLYCRYPAQYSGRRVYHTGCR